MRAVGDAGRAEYDRLRAAARAARRTSYPAPSSPAPVAPSSPAPVAPSSPAPVAPSSVAPASYAAWGLCRKCNTWRACMASYPCGHVTMCRRCSTAVHPGATTRSNRGAESVEKPAAAQTCAECQARVDDYIKVASPFASTEPPGMDQDADSVLEEADRRELSSDGEEGEENDDPDCSSVRPSTPSDSPDADSDD